MHDTIPRRACRTGRQLSGFVRGDRIAVVFQTPYRWYPRSPRSCAGSDRIVVTGDAGSPKRKSGPPYPSPRRAGSSTPTVASGSCRRIRDKRSIRKSSPPALDLRYADEVEGEDQTSRRNGVRIPFGFQARLAGEPGQRSAAGDEAIWAASRNWGVVVPDAPQDRGVLVRQRRAERPGAPGSRTAGYDRSQLHGDSRR